MKNTSIAKHSTVSILGVDIGVIIFIVSYAILLSFSLLGHIPSIGGQLKTIENVALFILVYTFFFRVRMYRANEAIALSLLLVLSVINIYFSNDYSLFKLTLLLAAAKGLPFNTLVKADFILRIILIVLLWILCTSGIAPDVISVEYGVIRHSMGFTNPNTFGLACTILCYEWMYFNNMKMSLKLIVPVLPVLYITSVVAGSTTSVIVIVIGLILSTINKFRTSIFQSLEFSRIVRLSPLIFIITVFMLTNFYDSGNSFLYGMNDFLSNRLFNISYHLGLSGISLFGSDISVNNLTLDTYYAYLLIGQGIINTIFYIIAYYLLARTLFEKHEYSLQIILFCFLIYGLSERLWASVDYNILMLMFTYLLYHNDTEQNTI